MRRIFTGSLIALCLLAAGLVYAASSQVVTNPTPAVSATMDSTTDANGCTTWTVSGKVKPAYRGHGANVKLVCTPYRCLSQGCRGTVFPADQECDGEFCPGPTNVDACGNFSFQIQPPCGTTQLDNTNVCSFVVHVDDTKMPQACNGKSTPIDGPPEDPNGSAPCSGGYCPVSP